MTPPTVDPHMESFSWPRPRRPSTLWATNLHGVSQGWAVLIPFCPGLHPHQSIKKAQTPPTTTLRRWVSLKGVLTPA